MSTATLSSRPAAGSSWQGAVSLVGILVLWHLTAVTAASRSLPGPLEVGGLLWVEVVRGTLPYHLAMTLARVFVSLALALAIGSAIGCALGRSPAAERWFKPWVVVLLNVPAVVTVVLIYIWLGLTDLALVVAVALNKIPTVAVTVREGAARLDRDLAEMAHLYRFSWRTRLRHVVLPPMVPYLMAAARNGLALTWKIVLVAELLGRPNGVGFQLQIYFQSFDVVHILAYTAAFTAAVLAIEYGFLVPLERRLAAWRR
jgi:NitT/TauT family transport system permease protein